MTNVENLPQQENEQKRHLMEVGQRMRDKLEKMQRQLAESIAGLNQVEPGPVLTEEQIERLERKYAGRVELTDNVFGSIDRVIVAMDQSVFFPDQRAIAKSLDRTPTDENEENIDLIILASEKDLASPETGPIFSRQLKTLSDRWRNAAIVVKTKTKPNVWTRDRFTIATDPNDGQLIMIAPPGDKTNKINANSGYTTNTVSEIAKELGYKTKTMSVYFEGGDMRAVGKHLFLGKETLLKCFKNDFTERKYMVREYDWSFFEYGDIKTEEVGFGDINQVKGRFVKETGLDPTSVGLYLNQYLPYELLEIGDDIYPLKGFDNVAENDYIKEKYKTELGKNVLIDQSLKPGEVRADDKVISLIKKVYETEFGREVSLVGEGLPDKQPAFHIDMFNTPVPNHETELTIVAADMKETLSMLDAMSDEELEEESNSVRQFFNHTAAVMVAEIKERWAAAEAKEDSDVTGQLLTEAARRENVEYKKQQQLMKHREIQSLIRFATATKALRNLKSYRKTLRRALHDDPETGHYENEDEKYCIETLRAKAKAFDAYASWYQDRGFEIKRMPILPVVTRPRFGKYADPDRQDPQPPSEFFWTYNNVSVQAVVNGEKRLETSVYMPVFGLPTFDKHAVKVYNSLGARVEPAPMAYLPGAMGLFNCSTSEIRGPVRKQN